MLWLLLPKENALSEWVSDRHQDEVHEVEELIKETALENHIRQEERDIFPHSNDETRTPIRKDTRNTQ